MKLTVTIVTFIIASLTVSASPVFVDVNEDDMTLIKRVVGVHCKVPPGHGGCIARRGMNKDQFEEVGLVKRTRHKHHRHRRGHRHGHKSKGMATMPPTMAMGGDANGAAAGGMAASVPDMTASAGGADMSAVAQ